MILGASLALVREDLRIAGVLFGAALAAKVIASVFVAPVVAIAVWIAVRRAGLSPARFGGVAVGGCGRSSLLVCVYQVRESCLSLRQYDFHRSPHFDASAPFIDPRFLAPLSWRTAYDATFRSGMFFEGQGGGEGSSIFFC